VAILANVGTAGLAFAQQVPVAPTTVTVKAREEFKYTTNPLMVNGSHEAAFGALTTPELIFVATTPNTDINLDTRLNINQFNISNLSSTDNHTTLSSSYKSDHWLAGLNGSLDYDTTQTSELTGSGLNIAGIRHTAINVSPYLAYYITPVNLLQFQAGLLDANYSSTLYIPYMVYSAQMMWQHALSPTSAAMVVMQGSQYQTELRPQVTIDTLMPQIGWKGDLTDKLTILALAGYQQSNTRNDALSSRSSGEDFTYTLQALYKTEQNQLNLRVSRQPSPQSDGSQVQATSIALTDVYQVSPRLKAIESLYYQQNEYNSFLKNGETTYLIISPKLSYEVFRNINIDLTYTFQRSMNITNQAAVANMVIIGVSAATDQLGLW
jgi:hypothetical protein